MDAGSERPLTLGSLIAEIEALLDAGRGYPGYPGAEAARHWYADKRNQLAWGEKMLSRLDSGRVKQVGWRRSVASRFPKQEWELQLDHLERVVDDLRLWRDELLALPPAPEPAVPLAHPDPAPLAMMPARARGPKEVWAVIGVLITAATLLATVAIAKHWFPFEEQGTADAKQVVPPSASALITNIEQGQVVQIEEEIHGEVSKLPQGFFLRLFVVDTCLDKPHPQRGAIIPSSGDHGSWNISAKFGDPIVDDGVGYQLVLALLSPAANKDVEDYIRQADATGQYPGMLSLPAGSSIAGPQINVSRAGAVNGPLPCNARQLH